MQSTTAVGAQEVESSGEKLRVQQIKLAFLGVGLDNDNMATYLAEKLVELRMLVMAH